MDYFDVVKLFWIYQMIYNCDENEKNIEENIYLDLFKFIVNISHTGTPNNGGSHYFVMMTLFTIETTTVMTLWILYNFNIQKIDHRHDENKIQKSYGSLNFIMQDNW